MYSIAGDELNVAQMQTHLHTFFTYQTHETEQLDEVCKSDENLQYQQTRKSAASKTFGIDQHPPPPKKNLKLFQPFDISIISINSLWNMMHISKHTKIMHLLLHSTRLMTLEYIVKHTFQCFRELFTQITGSLDCCYVFGGGYGKK